MGDKTKIEWCDASWNPVSGCSHVSEGCRHCFAERWSHRYGWTSKPWTAPNAPENVKLHPSRLDMPLRWRRPRRIFVNSMSDLFHEQVSFDFVDQVFAVMARAHWHTYQVLTKRPERMRAYLLAAAASLYSSYPGTPWTTTIPNASFPLRHVWIGVSIEDQRTADERIPLLLQTPAAVRWISAEPLLGPITLTKITYKCPNPPPGPPSPPESVDALTGLVSHYIGGKQFSHRLRETKQLDWVVVGGESGPHARPMHPDWVRSLRDQCQAAGVAFYMKQLSQADGRSYKDFGCFPTDLQVRDYPNGNP